MVRAPKRAVAGARAGRVDREPERFASGPESSSAIAAHGSRALQEIGRLLDHTLERIEEVFGSDHPHYAQALDNYGASLRRLADLAQGRAQQIRASQQQQPGGLRVGAAVRDRPAPVAPLAKPVPARPIPSTKLLGVQDAARYLTISADTLYGLVRSGEIPHSRVGRSIRFRMVDLDRYVEDRTSQSWTRVDRRGRPRRR